MKLIIKISLLFLLISGGVFLVGGLFTFNAMNREIEKEEKWFLEEQLSSLIHYLERRNPTRKIKREKMVVEPLDSTAVETEAVFSDTLVTHTTLQRLEPHLKLDVVKVVNGRPYKIMLYDLIVEEDDIVDAVRESMIKTYLLLLGVLLVLSVFVSYIVFKPFQNTLSAIRGFSIRQRDGLKLDKTTTSEFKKLNRFIEEMTAKAVKDYQSLKEFSENASHEMQTPLSIAQGKLELLMETASLNEEQMDLISSAQQALRRISRMGSSLSLLAKIENKEFSDFEEVNLSEIVNNLLFGFRELIELKSIKLTSEIKEKVVVNGNMVLIEILVTNLLNNAIRHNFTEGKIHVELEEGMLKVTNTGAALSENSGDYFMRFKKGSENPDSTGLGLSIVKKICDEHQWEVNYEAIFEQHVLTIRWTTK